MVTLLVILLIFGSVNCDSSGFNILNQLMSGNGILPQLPTSSSSSMSSSCQGQGKPEESKIVGGETAKTRYPYIISLQMESRGKHIIITITNKRIKNEIFI